MSTYKVAAIVVNWNQEGDTTACLDSLRTVNDIPLHSILVDNGSQSKEVDRIEKQFPEVTLIRLSENRGPTGGRNAGIRYALNEKFSHILLLDNDILTPPSFLSPLIDSLSDRAIGAVSPKILHHPETSRIWCTGGMIDWSTGMQWSRGAGELDRGQWDIADTVDYLATCCLLAPCHVFQEAGLMDERYFIYYDDTDWSLRTKRLGYLCAYTPKSQIYHKVSSSLKAGSASMDYYYARNRLLFFRTHAPAHQRLRLIVLYTARALRYAHTLWLEGRAQNASAVIRGVRDYYLARFGRGPI